MAGPFNSRLKIKADYIAGLVAALAPLVYFFPSLREGKALSPDDGVLFNIPLRAATANIIRAGYLPLWDPYIFCGIPLHGAAQAGVLFPLNWFYLALSPAVATNLMMLSTYAVAGIGAYLYARRAGADIAGSIATSLIWQWSAFMVEQIGHTNILHTAALVPWTLWAVDGYLANGKRRHGILLAGLVALQVFAGHQQTLAFSLVLTGAYAFVMSRSRQKARRTYFAFAIFIVTGLALAAVQILPTFELWRNSLRATATYEFFGSFSLPPRFLLTFFAPYVLGGGNGLLFRAPYIEQVFYGEYAAYAGILTLMLASFAIVLKRDVRTKFWAAVVLVALFLALGRFLPFGIYQIFYHVPVLNLFRGPSRHLMEIHFALAVLSGRGVTAIRWSEYRKFFTATLIGIGVFLFTLLSVTWLRPAAFELSRNLPVNVLRAPELFLPIVVAALSAIAFWMFVRSGSSRALLFVFVVLTFDLFLYGSGSAWRTRSPEYDYELFGVPDAVKFLREHEDASAPFRFITQDTFFDPNLKVPPARIGYFDFSLQPDVYMMHAVENASGYDGFGLTRYSRLAGDMKPWGELTDPEMTLRGNSRELDLLNVRYLMTRPALASSAPKTFPDATATFANQRFAAGDLGLRPITSGQTLSFNVPETEVDRIALVTSLAWSDAVTDHTTVATITLHDRDGKSFEVELRAGDHSSEWSYDRPDIRAHMKHKRAPIATTYPVDDAGGKFTGHTYVSSFNLPAQAAITSGSITVASRPEAPQLTLTIQRISLAKGEQIYPIRSEWVAKDAFSAPDATESMVIALANQRWKRVADQHEVSIFENTRALPRAWLANEARVLSEPEILQVIRSGKFADGKIWDPRSLALLEGKIDFSNSSRDENASAAVTANEPNRTIVRTKSNAPAILVLSANHYPGWRAYVDGKLVETMRVDYNLRGVTLPAGEHNVEFVYRPKSVLIGLVISLLTLAGMVVWWKFPPQVFPG